MPYSEHAFENENFKYIATALDMAILKMGHPKTLTYFIAARL